MSRHARSGFVLPTLLIATALAGCALDPVPEGSMVDEDAFLAGAQAYRDSAEYVEVTGKAYASAVSTGADIRVWVSADAAGAYDRIDPDVPGSGAFLPVGTLIVRAVQDADGALTKLTLMGKAPTGYAPAVGDWWFAVTDPAGTPVVEDGVALRGRLEQCWGCHQGRGEPDDFLFGVPAAAHGAGDGGTSEPPVDDGPVCGDFYCERDAGESCDVCPSDCHHHCRHHG